MYTPKKLSSVKVLKIPIIPKSFLICLDSEFFTTCPQVPADFSVLVDGFAFSGLLCT